MKLFEFKEFFKEIFSLFRLKANLFSRYNSYNILNIKIKNKVRGIAFINLRPLKKYRK
jgi:hypothetical protein